MTKAAKEVMLAIVIAVIFAAVILAQWNWQGDVDRQLLEQGRNPPYPGPAK